MNEQLDSIKNRLSKYLVIINKNQVFIVLVIASCVLIFTLLQSRTYLDPERNEERYSEESLKINYATIDQEVVDELSATLDDASIDVDTNFVPGRTDPFSE